MKSKIIVLTGLIVILGLLAGYQHSMAESASSDTEGRIGVVDIRRIFEEGRRTADYQQQTMSEREQVIQKLENLDREIGQLESRGQTLRPGSDEHLDTLRQMMEKQGQLEALKQFHEQESALKDQRWTENIYRDILAVTEEVAAAKGLVMVVEQGRVELPAANPNELMLTIRTHKILSTGGCIDITSEVMERMDTDL